MSAYSDWKCGAIDEDQYISACREEDAVDEYACEQDQDREYTMSVIRDAITKALDDIGLELTDIDIEGKTVTITCEAYDED